jgi:S1-C subfamily serine protease
VAGVVIDRVNEQSAASVAGLQSGDIVIEIDGKKIVSSPDFMGKIGQHRPGDVLHFGFVRGGKKREALVKLSDSRNSTVTDITSGRSADKVLSDIGLSIRDLSSYEIARLPKDGVVVSDILNGSQIDQVNMEENFIITRLNGISISNVDGLKNILSKAGSTLYFQGYYENYPGDFAYSVELR